MVNDKQRRDVAAGLRLLDVSDIGDDDNIVDDTEKSAVLFMRILEIANDYRAGLHYFPSHFVARDAVELFADLIDRPTCFDAGNARAIDCDDLLKVADECESADVDGVSDWADRIRKAVGE